MLDELLSENEKINWVPEHIKWGRFGDWLENNIDWALSRERYWGTPLPIWRTASGDVVVVGSKEELEELAIDPVPDDLHRPYIDRVRVRHPETGEEATRVPEVLDAWFDSGSMPFAQWGYPHGEASEERFRSQFPADYICEAVDQTRGWFYSLLAVSTMLVRQELVQELPGPGAHPRRRGQEDEQIARQRHRPLGHLREAGRRRPALGALHIHQPRQHAALLRWIRSTRPSASTCSPSGTPTRSS